MKITRRTLLRCRGHIRCRFRRSMRAVQEIYGATGLLCREEMSMLASTFGRRFRETPVVWILNSRSPT